MRTLDAALTTAQQASSRTPYLRIYFDDRDSTTYTFTTKDSTNRIRYIEQWEEPYAGVTVIRLNNYDGYFTAKDLRGYSVSIGWGYDLGGSPDSTWYSNAATMKVLMQRDTSFEGELYTEFYCISIWGEIEQDYVFEGGKKLTGTISGTFEIGELVTGAPSGATGRCAAIAGNYIVITRESGTFAASDTCTGGTSSATISGISAPTTNYGILVYDAGDTATSARLASLTGLTVDVDEDDDLSSMADTPRLEVAVGTSVRQVIRRILLRTKCGMRYENDGHMHVLYLDTSDAAQYSFNETHAFYMNLRERAIIIPNTVYFVSGLVDTRNAPAYIGTANDSTSVNAIGTIVAPIQIDPDAASQDDVDNRAAAWIAQRVAEAYQGQIVAPMECGLEVYDMVQAVDGRMNVTAKGRIGRIERVFDPVEGIYETRLNVGSLYSAPGAMDVGPDSRDNDLRDLTSNLDPLPPRRADEVYPWQLGPALLPYTIDITFTITDDDDISWGAGTVTFADKSTQAIASSSLNLANGNPYYLYIVVGSSTLQNTQTFGDAVGGDRILIAFAVKGADTSSKALVVVGTQGPKLFVDTLSSITGDFGLINAGEVRIGTGTLGSNFTGWRLFVDSSIGRMAGYNSDTIQWYSDTDGKLYCGAGKILMSSAGIQIDGQLLSLRDTNGVARGQMYGFTDGYLYLSAVSNSLYLGGQNAVLVECAGGDVTITPGSSDDVLIDRLKVSQNVKTVSGGSPERELDTVYQAGDYPIIVTISAVSDDATAVLQPWVEEGDATPDIVVASVTSPVANKVFTVTFVVPPDAYYKAVDVLGGGHLSLSYWTEWEIGGAT